MLDFVYSTCRHCRRREREFHNSHTADDRLNKILKWHGAPRGLSATASFSLAFWTGNELSYENKDLSKLENICSRVHFISLWPWLLTFLPQGQCMPSDCCRICTRFGADGSSRFPFRVRTNKQTNKHTDATERFTHAGCIAADVGNKIILEKLLFQSKWKAGRTDQCDREVWPMTLLDLWTWPRWPSPPNI